MTDGHPQLSSLLTGSRHWLNTATVQQCVGQGLRCGKHIDLVGHGVSEHEAGRPALPFLEILDVATVDRGRDPARRGASIRQIPIAGGTTRSIPARGFLL